MYVRFVSHIPNEHSNSSLGVFQAAHRLRAAGKLQPHEEEWLEGELAWLNMHLKSPACLREPGSQRAICWFHPRAQKPIEKVRSIVALLEEHGVYIRMIKTENPGIIIYEDGWQVVAKPRRGN